MQSQAVHLIQAVSFKKYSATDTILNVNEKTAAMQDLGGPFV
jgi:hypothetical protein